MYYPVQSLLIQAFFKSITCIHDLFDNTGILDEARVFYANYLQ